MIRPRTRSPTATAGPAPRRGCFFSNSSSRAPKSSPGSSFFMIVSSVIDQGDGLLAAHVDRGEQALQHLVERGLQRGVALHRLVQPPARHGAVASGGPLAADDLAHQRAGAVLAGGR